MKIRLMLLFLLNVVVMFAYGQEAITVRQSALRLAPGNDAAVVRQLPEESAVTVLQRKGGWYEVKQNDGAQGWLKMISLRFVQAPVAGELPSVAVVRPAATVATGVRGLSEGGLSHETQTLGHSIQMARIEQYRASNEDARQFAREADLHSQEIPYVEN